MASSVKAALFTLFLLCRRPGFAIMVRKRIWMCMCFEVWNLERGGI